MCEKKLKYSILQYSPSLVSGESINLGVLAASDVEPFVDFIPTKKMTRIAEFDDSLDLDMLKLILQGIKNKASITLENYDKVFDIQKFVQFYCNEYHFSRIMTFSYHDFDSTLEELFRMYLPQDFAKEKRPSHAEELQFMTKILKTGNVDFRRNVREWGSYSEPIRYDFRINNYGIKLFWLNGKDLNRIITSVKAWAWNCQHSPKDVKTVIIYNFNSDESASKELQMILNIFKDSSDCIYSWTDGLKWLDTLSELPDV